MTTPIPPGVVAGAVEATQTVKGLIPGADAAASLIDAIVATRRWISDRHNWVRIMWFGSGVVLIIVGAGMLVAKPAAKAASVLPVGKAAAVVKG